MTRIRPALTLLILFLVIVTGCGRRPITTTETPAPPAPEPEVAVQTPAPEPAPETAEVPIPADLRRRLARMTPEQKIAQLFVIPVYGWYESTDAPAYRKVIDLVRQFEPGGVMFFQGEAFTQVLLANDLQKASRVPLLVSQDMEWGPGMRVERTTTFPRTMAIGASRNPDLARAAGYITAIEARALGVHQIYAPVADVNNNPANPIINVRSFGERPELVSEMVVAFIDGAARNGTIATVKHFPGHGDTATDSHADLPVIPHDLARLDTLELVPFRAAIDAGVGSIMTGHLAFPRLEPNVKVPATLSNAVTTGLLRDRLGFDGLIVTDALNMSGVTKNFDAGDIALRAVMAGADLVLMSEDVYAGREAILEALQDGKLTEARIDRSVLRILAAKKRAGLFEEALTSVDRVRRRVATSEHEAVVETIAREALTLLRNDDNALPIRKTGTRVFIPIINDGTDADTGSEFIAAVAADATAPVVSSVMLDRRASTDAFADALRQANEADVVVVPAYVLVRAWSGSIGLQDRQKRFLNDLIRTGKPVLLLSFGNPYIVSGLEKPAVYLVAYSSSPASQRAAAAALFGRTAVTGKLPVSIPGEYAYGDGMNLPQESLRSGLPEEVGFRSGLPAAIDSLMGHAIEEGAFPGAAVAIGRSGTLVHLSGYGHQRYDEGHAITPQTSYDLASLTKVVATTTAVMKLHEAGKLDLDAEVAHYLPAFGQNGKEQVTIRDLLTHTGGLVAFKPFHTMGFTTRKQVIDAIMAEGLQYKPGTRSVYSDFGPITIALVVEKITGMPFDAFARDSIFVPLGMTNTGFHVAGVPDLDAAPTEQDDVFRHRLIEGEVHDETAWLLGGTAGHAGLFSTVEDLSRFAFMMLNDGRIAGRQYLRPETIRLFTTAVDPERHTRALGWDTPSGKPGSSAGTRFGPRSFGHTGFTGTSIWMDPDQQLFVILLTNRVYPTRENDKIMRVRPRLANLVQEAIEGPPEPLTVLRLRNQH